ncbi:hypothetical protein R9X47_28730 [Wukongibacter baidiensis]|uniref:hypothetical protein n=1 Tax=Wukongibacter baidiensis TaxID=1723361 RepID=UPI003D7F1A7B
MKKRVLCFGCAEIYKIHNTKELCCPECGYSIGYESYKKIYDYAADAVEFGYQYRLTYEKEYERYGEIKYHYCLKSMGEVAHFLSIAALSGIIGNLSTDSVKRIILVIKSKIRRKKLDTHDLINIIDNEDKLDEFLEYIEDFYNEFYSLKPEIREAIYEEMIVHSTTNIMKNIMFNKEEKLKELMTKYDIDMRSIMEYIVHTHEKMNKHKDICEEYFDNMWENIEHL